MDSRDYKRGVPAGWPGHISRRENLATEPRRIDPENVPAGYGLAVKLTDNGDIAALSAGDSAEAVFGFIVAPEFSTFTPRPKGGIMGDVMRQGYMTVVVTQGAGAIKPGGAVYARINGADDENFLGDILAEEVAGETVAIPDARFVGGASANFARVAEIAFNL